MNFKAIFISLAMLNGASPINAMTILCLGDSLTEGYGLKSNEAWPYLLEQSLKSQNKDIRVINAGISGSTSASGPSRAKWHLKNLKKEPIDLVILFLGANDALRGLDVLEVEKNLTKTIEQIKEAKVKVILTEMKAPPNLGAAYTKNFGEVFQRIAKKEKIDLMPFILEGVAGVPKYNLTDGIHPNTIGHTMVAKNAENFLCKKVQGLKCH